MGTTLSPFSLREDWVIIWKHFIVLFVFGVSVYLFQVFCFFLLIFHSLCWKYLIWVSLSISLYFGHYYNLDLFVWRVCLHLLSLYLDFGTFFFFIVMIKAFLSFNNCFNSLVLALTVQTYLHPFLLHLFETPIALKFRFLLALEPLNVTIVKRDDCSQIAVFCKLFNLGNLLFELSVSVQWVFICFWWLNWLTSIVSISTSTTSEG